MKRFSAILVLILVALSFFVSCCDEVIIPSDPPASNVVIVGADIAEGEDTTIVASTSPANPEGAVSDVDTTVVIPAGATDTGSATLTVTSYSVENVGDFTIATEESNAVVGGIDLKLVVNGADVSEFSNNVTVTTYVAKGLTGVDVKYNGEGDSPTNVVYESETGKLTFETTHFSNFYVTSDSVAYIPETNTAYSSLQEAINAVSEGKTVKLINDITSEQGYLFDKNISVVLDLNDKILKVTNDTTVNHRAIKVTAGTLTIKNGTIDGQNVDSSGNPQDFNDKGNYTQGMYGTVRIEGSESTPAKVILSNVDLYNNHLWGLSVKTTTKYSSVEMYDSRVYSNIGGGIEVAYGNAKISDSVFNQQGVSNFSKYISVAIAASGLGSVEIEDTDMSVSGTHALYIYNSGGVITVKGGTFESTSELVWVDGAAYVSGNYSEDEYNSFKESHGGKTSIVNIEGGDFTGALKIGSSNSELSAINISGGTFDRMPAMGYIAEGYKVVENSDGNYEVKKVDTSWYDDSATSFELSNTEQLIGFEELVNSGNDFDGKTVTLTSNLDLGGIMWTPVGGGTRSGASYADGSKTFKGTFDGDGHTVSNFKLGSETDGEDEAIGFFGILDKGTVKNIKFEKVIIDSSSTSVGTAVGIMVNNSIVEEVTVDATCEISSNEAGGIVGRMLLSGTISRCENNASIYTKEGGAGGIVGKAYYSATEKDMVITSCTNNGEISSDAGYVGGIVGLSAAEIESCTNKGPVAGKSTSVGGIVGEATNCGSIKNCVNSGNVSNGSGSEVSFGLGGIVGWIRYQNNSSYGKNSYIEVSGNANSGMVEGDMVNGVGGIVGHVYNVAKVISNKNTSTNVKGNNFVSGIVGAHQVSTGNLYYSDDDVKNTVISENTTNKNISGNSCVADIVYVNNPIINDNITENTVVGSEI